MAMICWAAFFLLQVVMELPDTDKNPHATPRDIAYGKKLFAGRCAGCHGPNGDGGKGRQPWRRRAAPRVGRPQPVPRHPLRPDGDGDAADV